MYLFVMDDGTSWTSAEITDDDFGACADGVVDIFDIEDINSVKRCTGDGWENLEREE